MNGGGPQRAISRLTAVWAVVLPAVALAQGRGSDSVTLMDFAAERPNASPGTTIEVTDEHATTGKALKVTFPEKDYGWIDRWAPKVRDWSGYELFAVDVYNPTQKLLKLGVTIRDAAGTGAYDDRYNGSVQLGPGLNRVKIPLATMGTGGGARLLDMREVKSWGLSAGKKVVLYLSNLRLEGRVIPGLKILPLVDCDAGRTPNDTSLKVFLTDRHVHPAVRLGLKCVVTGKGWVGGYGTEGVATKKWGDFERFRFRAYQPGPGPMPVRFHLRAGKVQASIPLAIDAARERDYEVVLREVRDLGGRAPDLNAVHQWGLSFDRAYASPLYVSHIRLVRGDESRKAYAPRPKTTEEAALAELRDEAAAEREKLGGLIREARGKGIDTSYYEIYPVIAEVALDYRWLLPTCAGRREEYARFVAGRCRRAAEKLAAIIAGKRKALRVPAPPDISRLKARGRYFFEGDRLRLVVSSQDGVPGGNPLFTGPKFFIGSSSGSGGSRWDVRDCPIWDVYRKHPETHRVGWDGWCGHYICDAASSGGQGETVIICIESPLTRRAIAEFIEQKTVPLLKKRLDIPVHAINWEAAYCCYCDRTREMFRRFVRDRHREIEGLNKVWGTNYRSFADVELPHHSKMAENRAAWFDFADFNCHRFAEHYARVREQLDAADPRNDRLLVGGGPGYAFYGTIGLCGVDVEMMHERLDKGAILNEAGGKFYVTDLLKSIVGPEEMVADLEFHNSRPPLVMGHLLHGVAAIDWCEWISNSGGYCGLRAIPFNCNYSLREIELFLRHILDARRLEREIAAFDDAPREVALLYSRTSLLQIPPEFLRAKRSPYTAELINAYAGAQPAGAPLRFLTEKQLVSGRTGGLKVLLVPGVCYETPEAYGAAIKFVESGGTVLVTPNSWMFDQYNRPADYLAGLGIKVTAMRSPSVKRRVTVDLEQEGGFLQGETEEVKFSDLPRTVIRFADADVFAGRPVELKGAGILQELQFSGDARAIAAFEDGKPAVALVRRGKGRLYYLATPLEPASMAALLDRILPAAGVSRPVTARMSDGSLPTDFECRAVADGARWLVYVMNLGSRPRRVTLSADFRIDSVRNLSLDAPTSSTLEVPPKDVWILEVLAGKPGGETPRNKRAASAEAPPGKAPSVPAPEAGRRRSPARKGPNWSLVVGVAAAAVVLAALAFLFIRRPQRRRRNP